MNHLLPEARGLLADESLVTLQLVLLGSACFAMGLWLGLEVAWRASFAIDRGVLGHLPEYSLFSAFVLLVLMGGVGMYADEAHSSS